MPIKIAKNETTLKTYDIEIYGEIVEEEWYETDVSPSTISEKLKDLDAELLNVYINSPGGSVFAGIAIYNMLKRHKALVRAQVDGIAASIASVILQAGDERVSANNGMVMVHNPMSFAYGYASDLRKMAEDLDKVKEPIISSYMDRVEISREEVEKLMDEETFMTAIEASKYGFIDTIIAQNVPLTVDDGEITVNALKVPRKYENIYKNSARFKPYEPAPVVVDYSDFEKSIVENEIKLIESEVLKNELATNY